MEIYANEYDIYPNDEFGLRGIVAYAASSLCWMSRVTPKTRAGERTGATRLQSVGGLPRVVAPRATSSHR